MQNRKKIIKQISKIREINNTCWMEILSLAFEKAPKEAGEIFKKILDNDKKITELSKELIDE